MLRVLALAWRNFARNLRRYRVLLLALTIVVAVLVSVVGVASGLQDSLREKAARYFAGDIAVLGFAEGVHPRIDHPEEVVSAIQELGVRTRGYTSRSMYYEMDATVFHGGYYVRQRRLVGSEWELERPVLETFDFVAGGVPEDDDREGVLISDETAARIGAGVGDEVLIQGTTEAGQANTVRLTVRGVFAESSFFGYTAYMPREVLNELRGAPPDRVNEIGVYLGNPERDEFRAAQELTAALGERLPTYPVLRDRDMRDEIREQDWEERHYGVITLNAQLAEINDLVEALGILAGVIVVLFLGIIVIGVGNTYSMVVHERTREIGTLRALGMQRVRTVGIFLVEAFYLGALGLVFGGALGMGLLESVRRLFDFSGYAWAEVFLVQGRIQWALPSEWLVVIGAAVVVTCVLGAVKPAVGAGRLNPVEALREE